MIIHLMSRFEHVRFNGNFVAKILDRYGGFLLTKSKYILPLTESV